MRTLKFSATLSSNAFHANVSNIRLSASEMEWKIRTIVKKLNFHLFYKKFKAKFGEKYLVFSGGEGEGERVR